VSRHLFSRSSQFSQQRGHTLASIRVLEGSRARTYQVLYRDKLGRQRSETFSRKREAERRKSEVEVELRSGTYIELSAGRLTFGEWYARWHRARCVSVTRAAVEESVGGRHLLPRWSSVPLESITCIDAQTWVTDLSRRLSPPSVATCFRLLKLPLDAAVLDGRLRVNPVLGVRLPSLQRHLKSAEDVLTGAELELLIREVPDRWRALVGVLGWLGVRWGEGLGLRRRDVNLHRSEMTVGRLVVIEVAGRTSLKEGGKTVSATRTVPLPRQITDSLGRHMAFVVEREPDAFLFLSPTGRPPLRGHFLTRTLKPALQRAGLDDCRITMRQLRHTAASLMLDAGLAVQDVQERLGHSRPSTTFDVYSHLLQARQAGTAALEDAIARAAPAPDRPTGRSGMLMDR